MKKYLSILILERIRRLRHKQSPGSVFTNYAAAKELLRLKRASVRTVQNLVLISLGILSAGFGLQGFLLPNDFIDGGVTGISLLTTAVTKYPLPLLIVCLNIPFMILGFTQIGKVFAIKSICSITGLAIAISVINYPVITSDKLLIAAFGGFFLGAGIGLCVRGGAVLDGTEVLAIYISKKTKATIGDIILVFNIAIFSVAAYLLSLETALYAILTYMAAARTVDFIIEGVEEYTGVTIVSSHSDEIRVMITEKLGRGVTIYLGKRGFAKSGENLNTTEIVYTVITRLEMARLQAEVDRIDPNSFIVMSSIKDTKGGMIKRRPLKD